MTASESDVRVRARDESTSGLPWRSWPFLALLAATLMTPMDVPLVSPALTEVQAVFGVSQSRAGLFLTVYAVPGILLAPVVGALADRVGRRVVLSACLALFGTAGTAIGFTNDFTVALSLRFVQGFAAGSLFAALAMTVVGDTYEGRRHDGVIGVLAATLSVATAVYPALGGYLASISWNAPFLLYAAPVVVAVVVFVALPDPDRGGGSLDVREAVRVVPAGRALRLYGVMFLSYVLLFGGLYTALPFHLADAFSYSPTQVGLLTSGVLSATALVSTQNGRLAARFGVRSLLVVGFGLFAVALFGVGLATDLSLLAGSLVVFGVGSGLVTPTLFATLSSTAPDRVRAGIMSLQTTTIGASQAVGPALFTLLGARVGYELTILGAGGGAALVAVVLATLLPVDG
jgi:MFS family permease